MGLISRILMPVAFSARCRAAAHYTEALARHFQAEVSLLHVVEPPVSAAAASEALAYSTASESTTELIECAQRELETFFGDAFKQLPVSRLVVAGDASYEIVKYAANEPIGLILMPTHSYGPFRRLLLGSVTARVLLDAPCPVWSGPHLERAPAAEAIRFERVLCALDLGPHSSAALRWAARFSRAYGAHLTIVHILRSAAPYMGGFYVDPSWTDQMAKTAREQIANLQTEVQTEAEVLVETGGVAEAISAAAKRIAADVLVIGCGRHVGTFERMRTSAYSILRESPCPVVAV